MDNEKKNATSSENKNNKKKIAIIIIAVLLVAAAVAAAVIFGGKNGDGGEGTSAGETQVVAVTDENGEPVTDENGQPVTEVVSVTAAGGKDEKKTESKEQKGSDSEGNKDTDGKDKKDDDKGTTQKVITKPETPKAVTGLKVKKATEDSIEITWDKVKCNGYQISYTMDNGEHWLEEPATGKLANVHTANTFTLKNLEADTVYYFRVRAYNINAAGVSATEYTKPIEAKTGKVKDARNITINVMLPIHSGKKDSLEIYIDDKLVDTVPVTLDNIENDGLPYTTKKKYKGDVDVKVVLKGENKSGIRSAFGGNTVSFDLTGTGIDTQYDNGEDFE